MTTFISGGNAQTDFAQIVQDNIANLLVSEYLLQPESTVASILISHGLAKELQTQGYEVPTAFSTQAYATEYGDVAPFNGAERVYPVKIASIVQTDLNVPNAIALDFA